MTAREVLRSTLASRRGRVLCCYLPVGDPGAAVATPATYAALGVDVVEAGLPVADPVLDGPDITDSMARAIAAGASGAAGADRLRAGLEGLDVASVWMSYRADPDDDYLREVASSGAGGVILPDADQDALRGRAERHDLAAVAFVDHDPRPEQVSAATAATGYVMLAATSGVTGAREWVDPGNAERIAALREAGVSAPILLGFGLSTPDHARAALDLGADGVIVGTACLRAAREGAAPLARLISGLRKALDEH